MRLSSRNVLDGTVREIKHGSINSEVIVTLPGGQEIVAVITKASVERLDLSVGKPVKAIIKASSVILGVD
jgi:molybdopterin-binding protein